MPKIEVSRQDLFILSRMKDPGDAELANLLTLVKGEIDYSLEDELKIELNDTNRPDLWCIEGVARALRCSENGPENHLSSMSANHLSITVNPDMQTIRPYVAGFRATGWKLDQEGLNSLIAVQEKLSESFGKKRSRAAIGFHRAGEIAFPVCYVSAEIGELMEPLGYEEQISLSHILTDTEKGREYAHLLEGFKKYPVLTDTNGVIFSFPPILNSNTTGKVCEGDDDLFCDVTGTDWETVQLTATMLACNLEDHGAIITPVDVLYSYDIPSPDRKVTTPVLFADCMSVTKDEVKKVLGIDISLETAREALLRMDYASVEIEGDTLTGILPVYRRDGIHAVDMIEDIAISRGLESFEPLLPAQFTIGHSAPVEELVDAVRTVLIGTGCEEILRPALTSWRKIREITRTPFDPVMIANPMTEEYGVVRNTLLPGLLDVESTSAHASYPHRIFESGEILISGDDGVCRTEISLACLVCGNKADFGDIHSILGSICYSRDLDLSLRSVEDERFISGRCATVIINDRASGVIGEFHPAVLTEWGIARPASGFEININSLKE